MRSLNGLFLSGISLLFISACASTPTPTDNGAAAARAHEKSEASHQEMDRNFDPCAINSKLAVCKE